MQKTNISQYFIQYCALLILTKDRTCWRATIRYSSLIWMFSLSPTSAVYHSRSHSSRRSRAAEKKILPVYHFHPTRPSFIRHFAFGKERELGPNDAQRGCAENVEWILHRVEPIFRSWMWTNIDGWMGMNTSVLKCEWIFLWIRNMLLNANKYMSWIKT